MADTTENYGLIKPDKSEFYNVEVSNQNLDIIDEELKKKYDPDNKPTASDVGAVRKTITLSNVSVLEQTEEGEYYITSAKDVPTTSNAGYLRVVTRPNVTTYRKIYWQPYLSKIEYSNVLNNGTWLGWTTVGDFMADGSVAMSGNLITSKSTTRQAVVEMSSGGNLNLYNIATGDYSNSSRLHLQPETNDLSGILRLAFYKNAVESSYRIFGEHNKPSGSYTGNGSATERTIDTGGIGEVCIISTGTTCGLLTNGGFIGKNGTTVVTLPKTEACFEAGKIKLATANATVNYNGSTITYQVI